MASTINPADFFRRKHDKSDALSDRAQKVLVGGVNSPVRSFKRVGALPLFAHRGSREKIWDANGNEYIDLVMSYGPHLYGHAHPRIVEAVKGALENSSCLGFSSEKEIEWAEAVLARFPYFQKIRAVSTGTEACMSAIRLARGFTGRDLILKFAGHYHGHGDAFLFDAGSGVATLSAKSVAESEGVPASVGADTLILPFNDIERAEKFFLDYGNRLAGVILEPIMGNMGVIPPKPEFLKSLRRWCSEYGALLIFDEVMTGFRVGPQSAQGLYDIEPDLTTLGKIIGGGLPLAALMGRAEIMDKLAPLGPVYQAGTLSGNGVSMAAGLAMLQLIDATPPYSQLEKIGAEWQGIFEIAARKHKIALRVERVGSMISFYFRERPVENAEDSRASNHEVFGKFFWMMLNEGVMIPPSPFEASFLSMAHAAVGKNKLEQIADNVFSALGK